MKKIFLIIIVVALSIATSFAEEHMDKQKKNRKIATFAGGCFWCMEKPYEAYEGIYEVISGYTGGSQDDPSYHEVSSGSTSHLESVQLTFDPSQIPYEQLLDIFWRQIDPTDPGGQFADRGEHYTTAIFYHDDEQKKLAEKSKQRLEDSKKFDKPIVTKIIKSSAFYRAEEYHQDYYKKQPVHYKSYFVGSGRGPFLQKTWKTEK